MSLDVWTWGLSHSVAVGENAITLTLDIAVIEQLLGWRENKEDYPYCKHFFP